MSNRSLPFAAGLAVVGSVLAVPPVLAQQQTGGSDQLQRIGVILLTIAAVCVAMFVLTLGYLYRRVRGAQDELIPTNVDPYYAVEGQLDTHTTGELHPEMAHDDVGLDAAAREHGETPWSPPPAGDVHAGTERLQTGSPPAR